MIAFLPVSKRLLFFGFFLLGHLLSLSGAPLLSVDVSKDRHKISPLIYGMSYPDQTLAAELGLPIQRWGGTATSRFNHQIGATNLGSDYFFENVAASPSLASFLNDTLGAGSKAVLTVPLMDWVAKDTASYGFSISKYGAQTEADPFRPDAGNGTFVSGSPTIDPSDTSIAIDESFVSGWVSDLVAAHGAADEGGVRFYQLDNEPSLWNVTHNDLHPEPVDYDELRDRSIARAGAVKSADRKAKILGPCEWGWSAYFNSAADNFVSGPDRQVHGGVALVPWYLQEMAAYERTYGQRLLDYLDLHYYPQNNLALTTAAGDATTQALRLRSTRSLWDPTYTDESWINSPVKLIRLMRSWVNKNYPGTKLSISEYNFGGMDSLNGALAQTMVLGIFGREALDMAMLWAPPTATQAAADAFRIYRNYDGAGSRFGQTSVRARSTDETQLAIYAAQRSPDHALTIVVVNQAGSEIRTTLSLAGFTPRSTAQVWNLNATTTGIDRGPDRSVASAGFNHRFPANSVTLFVIPKA